MKPTVVDVDDLISEDQIMQWLVPLHEAVPDLIVTAYTIPNWMGPVRELRERYPWIRFGIHGFEHTFCEARGWTDELAEHLIATALEMGYEPLFKPPNWAADRDLEKACQALEVTLHHHEDYEPKVYGLKTFPGPKESRSKHAYLHTHILKSPVVGFIADDGDFSPSGLKPLSGSFKTPLDLAVTV